MTSIWYTERIMPKLVWIVIVVCSGMLIPIQAGFNAAFKKGTQNALLAGGWNTLLATLLFITALFIVRKPLPSLAMVTSLPWWAYLGGFCGATYVLVSLLSVPKLGAILLIVCLTAGQLIASVLIDHFGWVGYDIRPLTLSRICGVLCMIVGIYLVQR